MSLIDYSVLAIPKPESRKKTKARAERKESDRVRKVHDYVFARERNICRCCRIRTAQSMHEIRPRSLRGKVSRTNSIAVCGELGNGPECHGLLQRNEISVDRSDTLGAEATLFFQPKTEAAKDWVRLGDRVGIESPVMRDVEAE